MVSFPAEYSFSKAFDTVNHAILIKKLEHYGIRGLAKEWFISYLHSRKQFTSIGNTNSKELPISWGVPQGSVLGPLLFLLYTNDFKNCTSSLNLHLFADDSNLLFSHKNLAQLEMIINVELAHVQTWLSTNKLSLNQITFYSTPHRKKVNISIKLNINDTSLKEKPCIKYLGIMLDSNLNWKSHVNCISTKIKRSIGILSKMRYLVTLDVLISPYYTLIYPFLIYGLVVWGNTYPTNIKPLFILQKRTIRIITFSKFDEHSSQLFKLANILNFFDLVTFYVSIFMFKFHNQLLPAVFDNYFLLTSKVHNYNIRLSFNHDYSLPTARTNYGILI